MSCSFKARILSQRSAGAHFQRKDISGLDENAHAGRSDTYLDLSELSQAYWSKIKPKVTTSTPGYWDSIKETNMCKISVPTYYGRNPKSYD